MSSFISGGPGLLLLLSLLAATAAEPRWLSWQRPEQRYPERPGRQDVPAASRAKVPTALDLALLQQVTDDLAENEAVSPFVMSSLMTQVFTGAAGTTRDEMRPVLGLDEDPNTGVTPDYLGGYRSAIDYLSSNATSATVSIFNRMYVRRGFSVRPRFRDLLNSVYRSESWEISTPSDTARDINRAVSNVTRGKIQNLVSAEQLQAAELVLVSALYFKALWQYPFGLTQKGGFLTAAGERQVDMMTMDTAPLLYANLTTFEAVALPYTDEDFCLLLLRPPQRSMESVQALRDTLQTLNVTDIMGKLFITDMMLTMPKFKIQTEYSLPDTLSALGIREIFSAGADFSHLTDQPIFVSDVIHKVFMEVNEEGTEAAGAGAAFFTRSMPMHFSLDRPFVAVVYNKRHDLNLFSAYVASPGSEEVNEHSALSPQPLGQPRLAKLPTHLFRYTRLGKTHEWDPYQTDEFAPARI